MMRAYLAPHPFAASRTLSGTVNRTAVVARPAFRRGAAGVPVVRAVAGSQGAAQAVDSKPKSQSLAAKLGGAPAVRAAVDRFYEKMLADPRVSYFFEGVDMKAQRAHQAAFLTFAMGGSSRYEGNGNMTTAHARLVRDMGMTMEHFDITLQHIAAALEDLGEPQELIDEAAATVETLRPAFQEAIDMYGNSNA